jgi:PKD repeat protein
MFDLVELVVCAVGDVNDSCVLDGVFCELLSADPVPLVFECDVVDGFVSIVDDEDDGVVVSVGSVGLGVGECGSVFVGVDGVVDLGSFTLNVSWDPGVVDVTGVVGLEGFDVGGYYVDHVGGFVNMTGYVGVGVSGMFDLVELVVCAVGDVNDSCVLDGVFCELLSADPVPLVFECDVIYGLIKILPENDTAPTACFTWYDIDGGDSGSLLSFNASCSIDDYGIVLYEWDLDDDGLFNDAFGEIISFDFEDFEPHTVTLRVTDFSDQTNEYIDQNVQADNSNNILLACFTWVDEDGDGSGTSIDFNASCSKDYKNITLYEWDWNNDGLYDFNSSNPNSSHDFQDKNVHQVTLHVTYIDDQTADVTESVHATVPSTNPGSSNNQGNIVQNTPPIADASKSATEGYVGQDIQFDGSLSSDADGTINSYAWSFDDGSSGSGQKISHRYEKSGSYQVVLTVADNNGATDTDTIIVNILDALNNPPSDPVITGPTEGHVNGIYTYTIFSTDKDNDTIHYEVTWGDGAKITTEPSLHGVSIQANHTWTKAGRYQITVKAIDTNNGQSKTTSKYVLIDAIEIFINGTYIGYLIDNDGDNIFDSFEGRDGSINITDDGTYLIDKDGDGKWDYIYDAETNDVTGYKQNTNTEEGSPSNSAYIVLGLMLVFLLILLSYIAKKKSDECNEGTKVDPATETKGTKTETTPEKPQTETKTATSEVTAKTNTKTAVAAAPKKQTSTKTQKKTKTNTKKKTTSNKKK